MKRRWLRPDRLVDVLRGGLVVAFGRCTDDIVMIVIVMIPQIVLYVFEYVLEGFFMHPTTVRVCVYDCELHKNMFLHVRWYFISWYFQTHTHSPLSVL